LFRDEAIERDSMGSQGNSPKPSAYRRDVMVRVLGVALPLTLSVEGAAQLMGVGRSSMYAAVKRGDIPTARINGRIVVLTVPLLKWMGLEIDATASVSEQS
jgi:excisionase family DNA binding protein